MVSHDKVICDKTPSLLEISKQNEINSQDFANLDLQTARHRLEIIWERTNRAVRLATRYIGKDKMTTQHLKSDDLAIATACCTQLAKTDLPWLSVMVVQDDIPNTWILLICTPERLSGEDHQALKEVCRRAGWDGNIETEEVGASELNDVGGVFAFRIDNQ